MNNYIKKITKKDILTFLKQNNLMLAYLFDDFGEPLPPIEQGEDCFFIRCTDIDDTKSKIFNDYANYFLKKGISETDKKILQSISWAYSNMQTYPLLLKNFETIIIEFDDAHDSLTNKWVMFMYDKFGNQYRKDLEEYIESFNDIDKEI